jgi:subtilase family serine protease
MKSITSATLASTVLALGLAASVFAAPVVEHSKHGFNIAACPSAVVGAARCHAHVVTNSQGAFVHYSSLGHGRFAPVSPNDEAFAPVLPAQVRAAYNITGFGSSSTTIAIVDAYGYPTAEADLAIFRGAIGLNPCTKANGCLKIVNQGGATNYTLATNFNWDIEQAADLDTVSTMCPNCKILLVQAHSANLNDLAAAVRTAAAMGAHVISNSYGGAETGTTPFESAYNQPGIAVTASTGDAGYGVEFPASSPHVTAVGGTSLTMSGFTRVSETVWSNSYGGTGGGCSAVYNEPSWQLPSNANMANNTLCTMRMDADVSADGDPDTGVLFFINVCYPYFCVVGGTSVSNTIIAGIYGEKADAVSYASKIYANSSALFDITSGTNAPPSGAACGGSYLCVAGPGYDGPTGLGSPNGDTAF